MLDKDIQLPFYAKSSIFCVGLIAFLTILYVAQDIIIPIVFAVIIAILLNPLVNFFVKFKINRVVAILIPLVLTTLAIIAVGGLLVSQSINFSESWPLLVDRFTESLNQSIVWTSGYFNIEPHNINEWIEKSKAEIINGSSALIGQTLIAVGSWIVVVLLIPVYVFLILFYKPLILGSLNSLFKTENQSKVKEITIQTKAVIQQYLTGLLIETALVAIMEVITLFALGIEYALLLGIIGALLNLIPYVGGIVAVALPMMVAFATKSTAWYAVYVLIIYYIIQLIDNNYIVPIIVASKVKINALFSIIVVIVGNALWGVPGMFLSIPLLAIVKLIFDHIESLNPWGAILGDTMPSLLIIKPIFPKKTQSSKKTKNIKIG